MSLSGNTHLGRKEVHLFDLSYFCNLVFPSGARISPFWGNSRSTSLDNMDDVSPRSTVDPPRAKLSTLPTWTGPPCPRIRLQVLTGALLSLQPPLRRSNRRQRVRDQVPVRKNLSLPSARPSGSKAVQASRSPKEEVDPRCDLQQAIVHDPLLISLAPFAAIFLKMSEQNHRKIPPLLNCI